MTFSLFAKLEVNGPDRAPPLHLSLRPGEKPRPRSDTAWNFANFAIGKDGALVARFAPTTKPDDPALLGAREGALAS